MNAIHSIKSKSLFLILLIISFSFFLNAQQVKPTGDLLTARVLHQMQVLPNGKVLVFGGTNASLPLLVPNYLASCEIYDPATELWTAAASMNVARAEFASVVTNDGKILAIAGDNDSPGVLTSVESYDPLTDSWTLVGQLPQPAKDGDAILMNDGTILLTSGAASRFFTGAADGSGTWTEHAMPNFMGIPSLSRVIKLNNDNILVVGGSGGSSGDNVITISQTLVVDTSANRLVTGHPRVGLALLPDGKVLIAGGTAGNQSEIYDPATNAITSTGNTHLYKLGSPLMTMTNGKIAQLGIGNALNVNAPDKEILEIYDPANGVWDKIAGHNFFATQLHEVSSIGNGKYLISGGNEFSQPSTTGSLKCYIFDENAINTGIATAPNELKADINYQYSSREVRVKLDDNYANEVMEIAVYEVSGKLLSKHQFSNQSFNVPFIATNSGIHIVRLANLSNGSSVVRKFFMQ